MTRRRKNLLIAAAVFAAAILIPVLRHYQLKAAVDRYRAGLTAKGEPMELGQVLPPPIPPERSSAELLTNACALLTSDLNVLFSNQPPAMRMVAPGKAMVGWAQPDLRSYDMGRLTNSWAEVEAALAEDKAALDLLRQLPAGAQFDFAYNYSNGWGGLKWFALAPAKKAAQRLAASATSSLRRQDAETATRDVAAMQAIACGFSHDRVLISELVRIAIAQIAVTANWEFLQSSNVTDGQLARLQSGWAGMEFTAAFENTMLIERTVGTIETRNLRASGLKSYFEPFYASGLLEEEQNSFARLTFNGKAALWRYWWSYPDELRQLQAAQAVLDAARQARTNGSFLSANTTLKQWFEEHAINSDDDEFLFLDPMRADFRYVLSSGTPAFAKAFDKVLNADAARQLALTAIALKRFHLKYGRYPAQLSELTPAFLASVPSDPVDGKPLRYQRNPGNTFLLYSIGADGVNNGGDASPAKGKSLWWQNGRDWVWPQPATDAEIRTWEAQQAKSRS